MTPQEQLELAIARRDELRALCLRVDAAAAELREQDKPLSDAVRDGFVAHDELRRVERRIRQLKEAKRG